MAEAITQTTLHKRLSTFVDWIKPEPEKRQEIKDKADEVRETIRIEAKNRLITIKSTPYGGSFASNCGLRRHYRGNAEIDGLDVDIPFVVEDREENAWSLTTLLDDFFKIVDHCYPDVEKEPTKSSIRLKFSDILNFDIVPMIVGKKDDEQILIRSNGDRIKTSITKHVEFIKSRTKTSNEETGRVKFNECLRLMKWWRENQANNSVFLGGDDAPPSFLMNLLAAKAFDEQSVEKTYAETMAQWYGYLAHITRNKKAVLFQDYTNPKADENLWTVMDPVNETNNVVKKWSSAKINELATWLENGRDSWHRIIRFNEEGQDSKCLEELVNLFGNSFKNHCN